MKLYDPYFEMTDNYPGSIYAVGAEFVEEGIVLERRDVHEISYGDLRKFAEICGNFHLPI